MDIETQNKNTWSEMLIQQAAIPKPEDRVYTIVLGDGTKLENLKLNGTCFVSKQPISKEMFTGKLNNVEITGEGGLQMIQEGIQPHMKLIYFRYDETMQEYLFDLRTISEQDWKLQELFSNVDYLLMVTDA